jgi:hypothetical protein
MDENNHIQSNQNTQKTTTSLPNQNTDSKSSKKEKRVNTNESKRGRNVSKGCY